MTEKLRSSPLTALAVLVSVVVTVHCYVLPTRGLTFLWDDWIKLERLLTLPAPARWLDPFLEHWKPLYYAMLDVEYRLFGPNAWAFVIVGCLVHVLNVGLLGALLRRRGFDDAVAAVATAAFGVSTVYRETLWWAATGPLVVALTAVLAGLHGLESARGGRTRWLVVPTLAAFVAPTLHGLGLPAGLLLASEAALTLEPGRRARPVAAILGALAVYLALYAHFAATEGTRLPHTADELRAFATFFSYGIGVGLVQLGFYVPGAPTPGAALGLTAGYVAVAVALLPFLSPRERLRVVAAHAFGAATLGLVAVARWWWWQPIAMASSRYQYLPALAWTLLVAAALDAAAKGRRGLALGVGVALVALLGVGGLRAAANEPRLCAPRFRKDQAEFVDHLVRAVRGAQGPVYDANLPVAFPGRASRLLLVVAPDAGIAWTRTATAATLAPYRADPWIAGLPELPPPVEAGPSRPR